MVTPHTYRTEHSETHTTSAEYGDYYHSQTSKKIKIQPSLLKVLQYVDSNRQEFIEDLREAVRIKSVSGQLKYRDELIKMVKLIEKWMVKLNAKYECFYIGYHELDGQKVRLPPIILGTILAGPNKKTVCIYGNIDVAQPNKNKWDYNPWDITENNKCLYGNGIVLGKGALISWFHAIMAMKASGFDLPVNIRFIIQCMQHRGSEGLKDFLMTQKQVFLNFIDYIVVTDTEWLCDKFPCITYGCVGIIHIDVTITKTDSSKMDPVLEMEKIFEKLAKGDEILIPDFSKNVIQITPDEEQLYEAIEFDVEQIKDSLPKEKRSWNKTKLLMHFWRKSTIFVDEIKKCICEKKDQTTVTRHCVIKIVPKQSNEICIRMVEQFIKNTSKKLNTGNSLSLQSRFETRPWLEDCTTLNYEAARRATIQIYKEDPSMIRADRDLVCINILQMIEKNILLLPYGNKSSNGGGNNENIPLRNLYEGTKLFAAYLYQLGTLATPSK